MRILIVGGGKVGYYLAKTLAPERHQLVLVEADERLCDKIVCEMTSLGVTLIHGDGTDVAYLRDAGVERADILIAATGDDEINLVACQLAKNYFAVPRTVARVNNPKNINVFNCLGVDAAVSSTALIADILELEVDWGDVNRMLATYAGRYRIKEATVSSRSAVVGRRTADCGLPPGTEILSLVRDQQVIVPVDGTPFRNGDHVIALVRKDAMDEFLGRFR